MVDGPNRWSFFDAPLRVLSLGGLLLVAGAAAAACGSPSPSGSPSATAATSGTSTGSCTGVPGAHHARVVVEVSPAKVVARCIGFSSPSLPALRLIHESHIELGTQAFSFGVAICQVDNVPDHYSQCLASGKNYWALFVSKNGRKWTSPSVGVSDVTVPSGGSIGLRYDPPNGKAAPPPHPSPA